jgi:hypothetical protein
MESGGSEMGYSNERQSKTAGDDRKQSIVSVDSKKQPKTAVLVDM